MLRTYYARGFTDSNFLQKMITSFSLLSMKIVNELRSLRRSFLVVAIMRDSQVKLYK